MNPAVRKDMGIVVRRKDNAHANGGDGCDDGDSVVVVKQGGLCASACVDGWMGLDRGLDRFSRVNRPHLVLKHKISRRLVALLVREELVRHSDGP